MSKRIVIKIGSGSLATGYPAAVQIGTEGTIPQAETQAFLPPAPDLADLYHRWQQSYWQLGLPSRIKARDGITNVSTATDLEHCRTLSRRLRDRIHDWLDGSEFRPIREKVLEQLNPQDQTRILLQTQDPLLQRLPWYELHFFSRYRYAEVGICSPNYQRVSYPGTRSDTVRILAVLGDDTGLNTQTDQTLLNRLPNADIHYLNQPNREAFNRCLWDERGWDILFFAGHSSSNVCMAAGMPESMTRDVEASGEIALNSTDKLTIGQLKHALQKAIDRGLNTAIFNSCDGLGLAADLSDLHIPQVLVMREPVPDQVAHAFLQGFLESFSAGNSFYLSVREAREKLQGLESRFPCATWLPVIVQNLAETPPTWLSLQGKSPVQDDAIPLEGFAIAPQPIANPNSLMGLQNLNPLLSPTPLSPTELLPTNQRAQPVAHKQRLKSAIGCSVLVVTALLFGRQFGLLETWELGAYDQFIRSKPTEPADSRLLIITNTDADIAKRADPTKNQSLSDETLLALLNQLTPLEPQLIGLDIYRDFEAKDPALSERLKNTANLVTVCKAEDSTTQPPTPAIAPPPEIDSKRRLGSTDFVYADDPSGVLRRHLLFLDNHPPCQVMSTFSAIIAQRYLEEKHNIVLGEDYEATDGLQMGSVLWPIINQKSFGGYAGLDREGYQMLLNYRKLKDLEQTTCGSIESPSRCLSVNDVLSKSPEELRGFVEGRIVLIGTTALNSMDRWITPFTRIPLEENKAPGIFLHAQMISQLISAELDKPQRPLYTAWSEPKEIVWISGWALLGGLVGAYAVRHYLKLGLWLLMGEGILLLVCWLMLVEGGVWVPWVPSMIALPVSAIATQATLQVTRFRPQNDHRF